MPHIAAESSRSDFPYELALACFRKTPLGEEESAAAEEFQRQHPDRWQAHLHSLRWIDLERSLARDDGAALKAFRFRDASMFCRRIAKDVEDELLVAALLGDDDPIVGWSRADWENHIEGCVYCRRMRQCKQAAKERNQAELPANEPLLREWLLEDYYRAPLAAVTAKIGHDAAELAVLFSDMAHSTEFSRIHGPAAARKKGQKFEDLLLPIIDEHGGTLVRILGDGLLSFFEDPNDAARCTIAMHRRLAAFNAADLEARSASDHEMHVRSGLHFGVVHVFWTKSGPDLAGLGVNAAARIRSDDIDQILLSEELIARLTPGEFKTTSRGSLEAKGVGVMQIHELHWREADVAIAQPPAPASAEIQTTLAAQTAPTCNFTVPTGRSIYALLIDTKTRRGYALPLYARIVPGGKPGVHACSRCDASAQASATRAVAEAKRVLTEFGFAQAVSQAEAIEWGFHPQAPFVEGASLGLAVALATAAAITQTPPADDVAVSGSVNGPDVIPVQGVEDKLKALRDLNKFSAAVVLPQDSLNGLPPATLQGLPLRLIGVKKVKDAIEEVLGPALGLTAPPLAQLSASTRPEEPASIIQVLRIEPAAQPATGQDSFRVGERVLVRVEVDRPCYLSLVNVGPTGNVTILLPNQALPCPPLLPGVPYYFPPRQGQAPPLDLNRLRNDGILQELAQALDAGSAALLLDTIDYPVAQRPDYGAAGTPLNFWRTVCHNVASGMTAGGLAALVSAAANLRPHNRTFAPWGAQGNHEEGIPLQGPGGVEQVIALASARPLPLTPHDFAQAGALITARPSLQALRDQTPAIAKLVLGSATTAFRVEMSSRTRDPNVVKRSVRTRGGPPDRSDDPLGGLPMLDLG